MSDTTFFFPEPRTDEECQAVLDAMFAEMQKMNARIQGDQARFEQLGAEIKLIQDQTRAVAARTQARLDALEKIVRPLC